MSRMSARARKRITSEAWFDLERACLKVGCHRLFDKLEAATVQVEKDHRRFGRGWNDRRYRLSVRTAALASSLRWVARGLDHGKPTTWTEAAEIRHDVMLALAIAEQIGPAWSQHCDALTEFDYAEEIC